MIGEIQVTGGASQMEHKYLLSQLFQAGVFPLSVIADDKTWKAFPWAFMEYLNICTNDDDVWNQSATPKRSCFQESSGTEKMLEL